MAQARQKKQTNKTQRQPDFGVDNFVYVSHKDWQTDRPSPKLNLQTAGPFKILKQVKHSYRLKLPPHIKIHNILHTDRLKKTPINPLPGQEKDPKPPITIKRQEK